MAHPVKSEPEATPRKDIEVQPLYTPADLQDFDFDRDAG